MLSKRWDFGSIEKFIQHKISVFYYFGDMVGMCATSRHFGNQERLLIRDDYLLE